MLEHRALHLVQLLSGGAKLLEGGVESLLGGVELLAGVVDATRCGRGVVGSELFDSFHGLTDLSNGIPQLAESCCHLGGIRRTRGSPGHGAESNDEAQDPTALGLWPTMEARMWFIRAEIMSVHTVSS